MQLCIICIWVLHCIRVRSMRADAYFASTRIDMTLLQSETEVVDDQGGLKNGTHDFFGFNHYTTKLAENYDYGIESPGMDSDSDVKYHDDPSWPETGIARFRDVPFGIRKVLNWIKDHYNNPEILITENGVSDDAQHYGSLDDQQRIRFYTNYINNVLKAIKLDGCNVTAYAAWSVMDNFEWANGYSCTFGLYRVDFSDPSRARAPKASVAFYRKLIADNGWPELK